MVQLSHPYMTTGKTIALIRWTFVDKVMSLLFNMLSRLVIIFLPRNKHLLISWLQSPSAVIHSSSSSSKSLQSCPTLCDPIDGSPPGFPVPGILQARKLEWVAISFSNAWKWKVKVKSLSRVRLLVTWWTAAYQPVHGIFQARVLEWGAIAFIREMQIKTKYQYTPSRMANFCFKDNCHMLVFGYWATEGILGNWKSHIFLVEMQTYIGTPENTSAVYHRVTSNLLYDPTILLQSAYTNNINMYQHKGILGTYLY